MKTIDTTHFILATAVKLTTIVASLDIDILLVNESYNLHVINIVKHLDACNGAGRY